MSGSLNIYQLIRLMHRGLGPDSIRKWNGTIWVPMDLGKIRFYVDGEYKFIKDIPDDAMSDIVDMREFKKWAFGNKEGE